MPNLAATIARAAQDAHAHARMLPRLVAVAVLLGVLFATLAGLVLRQSRQAYEARATATAESLASVAQRTLEVEFEKLDAALQTAQEHLRAVWSDSQSPTDSAVNQVLQTHRRFLPELESLRIADAAGKVRWGNDLPAGMPVDIADREYFQRARDAAGAELTIGGPLQSRTSGHWIIVLARPRLTDGRFDGIIYATINTEQVAQVLAGFEIGADDAISLRTSQLALVARVAPGNEGKSAIGSTSVSKELQAALARNPEKGHYGSQTAMDGVERVSAYRQLQGMPFIIVAGLASERFFAPWRELALEVGALAAVAWLLTCMALYILYRSWRQGAVLVNALAGQTHRVQALLKVAGDGIHIIDRTGHLVDMSDSFVQLLQSSRAKLIGRHISSWDATLTRDQVDQWLAQAQDGERIRVDAKHLTDQGRVVDVDLEVAVADISGERYVFASAHDITERKRLQRVLEESSTTIKDLYDNAPCGYHSLNRDGVFVHVNSTMLGWLGCREQQVLNIARLTDFLDESGKAVFQQNFQRLQREGRLDGVELRLQPPGGPPRVLRVSAVAVYDEAGQFVKSRSASLDITALHQAQLDAARLLLEQSAMLDNDIVGMAKLTGDLIIWKNRALDRLFGYSPEDLADSSIDRLFPSRDAFTTAAAQARDAMASGANFRAQIQMQRKDGDLIWVDLSGVRLADGLSFWTLADITAMRQSHERIEHIAFHDELTGLANRVLLNDRMRQAIALVHRDGVGLAVCYLDLDGFKPINDLHGHDAGDAVLREIAARLSRTVRAVDTVARIGGDEFVVLLLLDGPAEDWVTAAQRLIGTTMDPVVLPGGEVVHIGMSVGVALCPRDGFDATALLTAADQALLQAKRDGKGQVRQVRDPGPLPSRPV